MQRLRDACAMSYNLSEEAMRVGMPVLVHLHVALHVPAVLLLLARNAVAVGAKPAELERLALCWRGRGGRGRCWRL